MFRRGLLRLSQSGPFDPYKILGVAPTASTQEIKKAYHKLALRFHPDGGPEGNNARFQAVHEAYDAVKDGKWTPPPPGSETSNGAGGASSSTAGAGGGAYPKGWNETRRMYVYEEPGSTSENYVENDPGLRRNLQIMMVVCFGFIFVRGWLYYVFPHNKRTLAEEERRPSEPSLDGVLRMDGGGGQPQQQQAQRNSRVKGSVLNDDDWQSYRRSDNKTNNDEGFGKTVYDFSSDSTKQQR